MIVLSLRGSVTNVAVSYEALLCEVWQSSNHAFLQIFAKKNLSFWTFESRTQVNMSRAAHFVITPAPQRGGTAVLMVR